MKNGWAAVFYIFYLGEGVDALESFIKECGLPTKMKRKVLQNICVEGRLFLKTK